MLQRAALPNATRWNGQVGLGGIGKSRCTVLVRASISDPETCTFLEDWSDRTVHHRTKKMQRRKRWTKGSDRCSTNGITHNMNNLISTFLPRSRNWTWQLLTSHNPSFASSTPEIDALKVFIAQFHAVSFAPYHRFSSEDAVSERLLEFLQLYIAVVWSTRLIGWSEVETTRPSWLVDTFTGSDVSLSPDQFTGRS